jgi:hypothetical protein
MLRGYNRPRKSDIFGPSSTGGRINHAGQRDVYQEGEGIGSFFSSIFRKLIPFVTKTAKTVAGSSIVKGAGQALQDSAVTGLTNVAADLIGGKKNLNESVSENMSEVRKNIASAIKASSGRKRPSSDNVKAKVKAKGRKKRKIRRIKQSSIFDDDEYD